MTSSSLSLRNTLYDATDPLPVEHYARSLKTLFSEAAPEATADQKSRLDMLVQKVLNVGIDSKAQIQERTKEKVGKVMKETEEIKGKFMDIKKFTLADKRGKPIKEELEMEKKKRQMLLDEIKRLGEAKEEVSEKAKKEKDEFQRTIFEMKQKESQREIAHYVKCADLNLKFALE
ncbi:hypothetical protein L5515_018263 [Caenorhabditis briggsae]|uniref:Uncharacterized protein n=1 Tax=Caenorhabditis briggsae TaxID=6238 RepID=A0AAE9FAY8_CAEBR|nr:hypothetical protein L5515_018263 [Caenorhabditis briggsae]